jgi:hypothetical protein
MAIINEAGAAPTQMQGALANGLNTIDSQQTVTFQQYTKSTIPTDGYVFWVASGVTTTFTGSLHIITEQNQDQDQTIAINRIIFTSLEEVSQFNTVSATTLWVGAWLVDGVIIKVVFNDSGTVYQQAGLWHYSGDAVYPALQAQLIANIADLPVAPIVSNSLPIWLSQNTYAPVYASFLVPENIQPPYIVAHIDPESTETLGQFPIYTWPGTTIGSNEYQMGSSQLMKDKVELTLYGFTNQLAIQYLSSLMDYSLNTDTFGFCNSPSIKDEKRKQSEIAALAMKKSITILASYYQATADAVVRRLILSATPSYTI